MKLFHALDPHVEVSGETILSLLCGMDSQRPSAIAILAKHQIVEPKPGQWYPQQSFLDAFKEIAEQAGDEGLYTIGQKFSVCSKFPPSIDAVDRALAAIDVAYQMNHRGGQVGSYTFQLQGDTSGQMVCNTPYPCSFDRGLIKSMVLRFKPKDSLYLSVKHDDTQPCRAKGGSSCTYLISW